MVPGFFFTGIDLESVGEQNVYCIIIAWSGYVTNEPVFETEYKIYTVSKNTGIWNPSTR